MFNSYFDLTDTETEINQVLSSVDSKIDTMHKQLGESRDSMHTKADYLEKERNNVIHLVNVTSAYITELENSLKESRAQIEELQSAIDETRSTNGKRIPPEGMILLLLLFSDYGIHLHRWPQEEDRYTNLDWEVIRGSCN